MICWVSINAMPLIEGFVSLELRKLKWVILRFDLVCKGGGICILTSYLTLESFRIIRGRETLKENKFTFSFTWPWKLTHLV